MIGFYPVVAVLLGDVGCGRDQLVEDPQVAHNELFWDVPVGDGEATFRTPGSPFRFSLTPAEIRNGVPRAGQHTSEFFAEAEVDGAGSGA